MTIDELKNLFGPGKRYTYSALGGPPQNAPRDFSRMVAQLITAQARLSRVGITIHFSDASTLHHQPPQQPNPGDGSTHTLPEPNDPSTNETNPPRILG